MKMRLKLILIPIVFLFMIQLVTAQRVIIDINITFPNPDNSTVINISPFLTTGFASTNGTPTNPEVIAVYVNGSIVFVGEETNPDGSWSGVFIFFDVPGVHELIIEGIPINGNPFNHKNSSPVIWRTTPILNVTAPPITAQAVLPLENASSLVGMIALFLIVLTVLFGKFGKSK